MLLRSLSNGDAESHHKYLVKFCFALSSALALQGKGNVFGVSVTIGIVIWGE